MTSNAATDHESPDWKEELCFVQGDDERFYRVAYRHAAIRYWIGGVGYVTRDRVQVWDPGRGETWAAAGEAAAAGERFGLVLTPAQFEERTFPPEDLPPLGRRTARRMIEQAARRHPNEELTCRFTKRTGDEELRVMRCRYDREQAARTPFGFDPQKKALLPVYDLDKEATRFISLDGVRTVGAARHEVAGGKQAGSGRPARRTPRPPRRKDRKDHEDALEREQAPGSAVTS